MKKQLLREAILDQHIVNSRTKLITRTIFSKINCLIESPQIIILSGLRRCGKSTLLGQIRAASKQSEYYINFDDDRLINFELADFQILYELFVELYGEQKCFYFDEIQNITGWERFVRRLHDQGNKVYVTGSNATMLSAELGTRLTGRYIEIKIYPYSFIEFIDYKNLAELKKNDLTTVEKGVLKSAFNEFMHSGGLPEYLNFRNPEYLHSLYESILYRDIIVRHKINHVQAAKELIFLLASSIGKECSYNSLKKSLGISSASTISDYCSYLQDSFLCYFVNRFDYSLRKQLQYAKKIYFIDQALAVNIGFRFSKDQGRLLENIIFLELKRRGYEIYFHQAKKQCDFLIRQGAEIITAIQVCVEMDHPETRDRELAGLIEAMETYSLVTGLIITDDIFFEEPVNINGKPVIIKAIPAWHWLKDTAPHMY